MRALRRIAPCFAEVSELVHAARWRLVWDLVSGLVAGARATVTDMGRWLPRDIYDKHGIKCADRALSNRHLFEERGLWYRAIARHAVGEEPRPIIIIDGTDLGSGWGALRASVAMDGRGVTILDEVCRKGALSNPQVHRRFLQSLQDALPAGCRPILVVDGGFMGPFFRKVCRRGWDYVGRLGAKAWVHHCDGRKQTRDWFGSLRAGQALDLGLHPVTWQRSYKARVVLFDGRPARLRKKSWHQRGQNRERKRRLKAREPWALVTSCEALEAQKIVDIYGRRMQIEESFRDDKSWRFGRGFALARCRKPRRLAVMLLLLALAQFALLLIGLVTEERGQARHFQANTVRNRRVVSLAFLGARVVNTMPAMLHLPDPRNALRLLRLRCASPSP